MVKYDLRIKARELRSQGMSVGIIAKQLGIAKSTTSVWVRDIILTVEQLEELKQSEIKGAALGRLRGALSQKNKRLKRIEQARAEGIRQIGIVTDKEFLIAGLALYWGEGSKKTQVVSFCNSDPEMIKFLLHWLKKFFSIASDDVTCTVGINELHREREEKVRKYWSQVIDIPLERFRKTSFKKVVNKKVYENFNDHYGVLTVKVLKPAERYFKLIGLIEGLRLSQGSSVG